MFILSNLLHSIDPGFHTGLLAGRGKRWCCSFFYEMIIVKFYKMILRLRCNLGFSCVSNHDILHFAITSVKVLGGVLAGGDPSPPPPSVWNPDSSELLSNGVLRYKHWRMFYIWNHNHNHVIIPRPLRPRYGRSCCWLLWVSSSQSVWAVVTVCVVWVWG